VHIGDGAIIAANAVVASKVAPYTIVGGNPARLIRRRFDEELTEYLLQLKWWDWPAEKIFRHLDVLCNADLERIRRIE
jgi:virginiamycin A acetyltransferase